MLFEELHPQEYAKAIGAIGYEQRKLLATGDLWLEHSRLFTREEHFDSCWRREVKQSLENYQLKPLADTVHPDLLKLLLEIELTYHSLAIENNRLGKQQIKELFLDKRPSCSNSPSLRKDVNEAVNHFAAWNEAQQLIIPDKRGFTLGDVLRVHRKLMGPEAAYSGKLREHHVQVSISKVLLPVQLLMSWLASSLATDGSEDRLLVAFKFHAMFLSIHPFMDGNGRLARILTNVLLTQQGYPPVIITVAEKERYFKALQESDADLDFEPLLDFMLEVMYKTVDAINRYSVPDLLE